MNSPTAYQQKHIGQNIKQNKLRMGDLNPRPLAYEASELTTALIRIIHLL